MDIKELNGQYICPEDKNYYIEIINGEYVLDYGDGGELEFGKIELLNDNLYTIQEDKDINERKFKYRIGTIRNNKIENIYKLQKETKTYNRYVFENDNCIKTLDIYEDGSFEFEYIANNNSIFKGKIYKDGIYKKVGNELILCIKTTYKKNIFNKKTNIKEATLLVGDNYYIDEKYYIDKNGDLCVIEFVKQ